MFMRALHEDPDEPGMAESLIADMELEFSAGVPYTFDSLSNQSAHAEDRFTVEYSFRDFLLLNDNYHNRGYEVPYEVILWSRHEWNARAFLEHAHAVLTAQIADAEAEESDELWTSSNSENGSWSNCGFNSDDDNLPPPPPPAAGTPVLAVENSNDESELGEPPALQDQSESESECDSDEDILSLSDPDEEKSCESDLDEIPGLQDVSDSEDELDDDYNTQRELKRQLEEFQSTRTVENIIIRDRRDAKAA
ncbi:hypothetical protein B0H13DRAFT_1874420 [Mycena leptocephala]|nr:hypothetical protein B0H13DRAFT_1874420 [Mycena leptocephala]